MKRAAWAHLNRGDGGVKVEGQQPDHTAHLSSSRSPAAPPASSLCPCLTVSPSPGTLPKMRATH